jgi:TetR/AcrR family transcriptional regulator, transcriptional repressor for nem operon
MLCTETSAVSLVDNIPTGLYCSCVKSNPPATKAEATRRKILDAAFWEFYKNGFQGGSLNEIVDTAGTTKGALFHHFAGKQELGYAVVDEIIGPILGKRWLAPLADSADPIATLRQLFRQLVKEDIKTGAYRQGCPLNNLAQEMSPLDDGFRKRIDRLYADWRKHYAEALEAGIAAGKVRKDVTPRKVAAFLVASQMGIWGTGKSSQSEDLMAEACDALCGYLEALKR